VTVVRRSRPVMLFACSEVDTQEWLDALRRELPDVEVRVWPDAGDLMEVTLVVVWKHPAGMLRSLPNLHGIFSIGAGVDSILADADLPCNVPIVRMVDPGLAASMKEFVLMRVLHYHRDMDRYARDQSARAWNPRMPRLAKHRRVGLMGIGVLGSVCARSLAELQFDVAAWSRRARAIDGARSYSGAGQLSEFLRRTDILVCMLPLTAATDGILNRATFGELPRGAFLINVARGQHVVEADLIEALDSGHLEGATLDVFGEEPLPPHHPYWSHPRITVVPHIAALTQVATAAATLASNVRSFIAGRPIRDVVDRSKGY
jgi:glyoxylate/hydroxypyruvate reductase